MFISDKIVFLELHKTGCSHIRNVLNKTIPGELKGEHNALQAKPKDKYVIGSIRNPWVWYVSLWAYGCMGKGNLRIRLSPKANPVFYFFKLVKDIVFTILNRKIRKKYRKNAPLALIKNYKKYLFWRKLYSDVNNVSHFQEWLQNILVERKKDIPEGYNTSKFIEFSGFMTYRYFHIFYPREMKEQIDELTKFSDLESLDVNKCPVDFFIRNESLEADLIEMLKKTGHTVDDKMLSEINTPKRTNQSKHLAYEEYYDEKLIALVSEKEKFIIAKFGYKAHSLIKAVSKKEII